MPDRKKLTDSVADAGKQALASDTGQLVVAAIADKMQQVAQEKAGDVSQVIKERATKAAGRKRTTVSPPTPIEKSHRATPAMTGLKDKVGDAASAVSSAPAKVGSAAEAVGSTGKKAAEVIADNPLLVAATSAAALGAVIGGTALVRKKSSNGKPSAKKSPAKKSSARRSSAKKSPAKKSSAKKTAARKGNSRKLAPRTAKVQSSRSKTAQTSPARKKSSTSSQRSGSQRSTGARKRSQSSASRRAA
jgi:DNA-binding protein HU-beta